MERIAWECELTFGDEGSEPRFDDDRDFGHNGERDFGFDEERNFLEDELEEFQQAEDCDYQEDEFSGGKRAAKHKNTHNKRLGRRGEQAAARYLEYLGYEILERNWMCPAGEADIIALDGDCLVFCEVKTRTNLDKGLPCEAVTPKKRKRYEKIAAWYLKTCDFVDIPFRFDIVDLLVVREDRAMLRHFVNAFGAI